MSESNHLTSSPTMMTPITPSSSRPIDPTDDTPSYFQKTVCLQTWWLIKAEKDFDGRRLGIAGLTSPAHQLQREFKSAPILKRHDVFTLETVDGVIILIEGFINQDRTKENGFPSEVFNHFVYGFPPLWEEYAEKWCGKEPTVEDASMNQIPGTTTDAGEICSLEDALGKSTSSFRERDISRSQDNSCDLSTSAVNPSGSASAGQASLAKKALEENAFMSNSPDRILEVENTNYSSPFAVEKELPCSPVVAVKELPYAHVVAENVLPDAPVVAEKEVPGAHVVAENVLPDAPVVAEKELPDALVVAEEELLDVPVVAEEELPDAPEKVDKHKQPILTTNTIGKKKKVTVKNLNTKTVKVCASKQIVGQEVRPVSSGRKRKVHLDSEANGLSKNRIMKIKETARSSVKFVDAEGNFDSDTVVKKKVKYASNSVNRSLKKTKRKLRYESPLTPKRTCIPPGSSSPKRSRSGRLLLPTMEFWRNQMPIYDASGTIIGVKDDLHEKKFDRGSVSEPPRKRK